MNLFSPLVSIVIPVYNGANFMREAIDSALAQTYPNIEVLVVNDGSTDSGETATIARSYGTRIVYLEKPNGGCASALNLGIQNMRGEYFSWLSHDDFYAPSKIARQIEVLALVKDTDTILYAGYHVVNSKSVVQYSVRPETVLPLSKLNLALMPLFRGLLHGCAMLIPKSYFDRFGLFDEALRSTQDYDLWFKFLRQGNIRFDSEIGVYSRVHPGQGTHQILNHNAECNRLWIGFLDAVSDKEMSQLDGSPYSFLIRTEKFLRASTTYSDAADHALELAAKALNSTKISVVIPFFNRVAWAVEAVRSVQAQTHPSFEIILVNDGSTDDIRALKILEESDLRIQILNQENAGPAKARNTGVKHATGQYVAFLDSDDAFYPEKLERQLKLMTEEGAFLSHTSYQQMDLEGNVTKAISSGTFSGDVFPRIIASCPIAMPTVMGSRQIFLDYPFPEDLEIGEDVCQWIRLTSMYGVFGIDAVLTKVRVGPNTAAFNRSKQMIGLLNIATFVSKDSFFSQYHRQIRSLLLDTIDLLQAAGSAPLNAVPASPNLKASAMSSIRKVLTSVRNHGVRTTAQKIRRHLGL
jgi:glycosyltransferase involved in cell wall biosynthesis